VGATVALKASMGTSRPRLTNVTLPILDWFVARIRDRMAGAEWKIIGTPARWSCQPAKDHHLEAYDDRLHQATSSGKWRARGMGKVPTIVAVCVALIAASPRMGPSEVRAWPPVGMGDAGR
jgi:hypothetical protein